MRNGKTTSVNVTRKLGDLYALATIPFSSMLRFNLDFWESNTATSVGLILIAGSRVYDAHVWYMVWYKGL